MQRTLMALITIACAVAANAQTMNIQTTRNRSYGGSSFSIGPRLSSYSTDFEGDLDSFKTGRQSAFGLVGDYRSGQFVLDFSFDHDPENGIRLTDIVLDVGEYSRDRGEATAGFAVAPFLDLQGGIRFDTIRVGGASFLGVNFGDTLDIDHQALTAGARIHSGDGEPVGFYLLGRGYIGSAKFDIIGDDVDTDTSGFRAEGGISIRLGQSNWSVVPGLEYEHLETDDFDVRLNTNRFFLNFVYRTGM